MNQNRSALLMNRLRLTLVSAALVLAATAIPAYAASSAASELSNSVSTSVGSLSTSVGKSSDSSKKKEVAQGDYRVIEVAALDAGGKQMRVTLQAMADGSEAGALVLTLPREAAERGQLAAGRIVAASTRPYGVEFAAGAPRQAFFLALHDEWYRELNSLPVVL